MPTAFVAVTLNVYGVVASRPVTTHDDDADVQVRPPGEAVTVYPVIGEPPSETMVDHETVT